jgi:hypothetical protein
MQQPVCSLPQYNPSEGVPAEAAWASLPAFTEDMPDCDYTVAWGTFDGHFEQAHDNFHGWVGGTQGEMADNTYTAFDPIFLSYHCNMDRLFEHYLRSYPNTRVTAAFPLKPFTNKATDLDYTNPILGLTLALVRLHDLLWLLDTHMLLLRLPMCSSFPIHPQGLHRLVAASA